MSLDGFDEFYEEVDCPSQFPRNPKSRRKPKNRQRLIRYKQRTVSTSGLHNLEGAIERREHSQVIPPVGARLHQTPTS